MLKIQYDRASSSTKTHVHSTMSYQQLVSVSCAVTETALQHFLIICLEQWVLWHSTRKVNVIHVYIFICLLKVKQTQKGSLFSVISIVLNQKYYHYSVSPLEKYASGYTH